jgi:hypothetical protein
MIENLDALPTKENMAWSGMVTAVQPRIRLTRSFDQRSHAYLGYLLRIEGVVGGERTKFRVAIGSELTAPTNPGSGTK